MLKNILKLDGTQQLSKDEQKTIKGSGPIKALCPPEPPVCPEGNSDCQELIYFNTFCVNR